MICIIYGLINQACAVGTLVIVHVTDQRDNPIKGAHVDLDNKPHYVEKTDTGSDGIAMLHVEADGKYHEAVAVFYPEASIFPGVFPKYTGSSNGFFLSAERSYFVDIKIKLPEELSKELDKELIEEQITEWDKRSVASKTSDGYDASDTPKEPSASNPEQNQATKTKFSENKPNQLSGTQFKDYTSILDSNMWTPNWVAQGSGKVGRPAYQSQPVTSTYSQPASETPVVQAPSTASVPGYESSTIVGEWNIVQITPPRALFGGSLSLQFTASFNRDGTVYRPTQYQGTMVISESTGRWTQSGDSISWTYAEVTNKGTIQGNSMSGVAYSGNGETGSWSAERVGS